MPTLARAQDLQGPHTHIIKGANLWASIGKALEAELARANEICI